MSFREINEPHDLAKYKKSYFNLLIEYNSNDSRREFPNEFETLEVKVDDPKYPGIFGLVKLKKIFYFEIY